MTTPTVLAGVGVRDLDKTALVLRKRADIDGIEVFYREAGAVHAPAVLLPHGYPCRTVVLSS